MKRLKKGLLNVLLALVMVFSFVFPGWGNLIANIKANAETTAMETEFTNNGQFSLSEYSGVAYSFVDGATEGLPAGSKGAVLKIADNGAAYVNVDFSASKISASAVESVVVRAYSPDYTADDELRINNGSGTVGGAGAHNMSTWCDIALPLNYITAENGDLGAFALGLRDKDTISPYFYIDSITVKMKETTKVTFTGIHSYWNHATDIGDYHSILEFSGGIGVGDLLADYSNLLAMMTLNDQPIDTANVSFICRNWLDGKGDSIIMKWVTSPAEGAILKFPAGATFTNGSADTKLYEIAEDIYLKFNGAKWEGYTPPAEVVTTPVTFTNINPTWNDNTDILGNGIHYTVIHLAGLQTSGYYTQGDDWTDMMAKSTINGGASYFNFCPASYIAGPDAASDFIILFSATAPTAGDIFFIPAGTTFKVGGQDANIYELATDICLTFNGTAWEVKTSTQPETPPVTPEEPPVETVPVSFGQVHAEWNNYDYAVEGCYCTFIMMDGSIGGGGLDGDFTDLLSKTTLNDQPIDTENVSFICPAWIGANNGIILRFKTLPDNNSILKMPAGATFTVGGEDTNVYEIAEDIELKIKNGKWGVPSPMAEFVGVNYWNNNIYTQAGTRLTLLDFDVEKLGNVEHSINSVTAAAGITINGMKVADIEGASVLYTHGANHMAIDLPTAALYPTAEYPITVMKVEEGTVFENYELPAITLSLIGGTWLVGEYETMPQETDYVTISDLTGETRYELGAESMLSAIDGYEGDVSLKFVYSSTEAIKDYAPFGGLAVYLNSTNLWDGWRIFFMANKVYVYDATMGGVGDEHVLIGEADFGIENNIELQIEISIKENNGKYSIVIGGSCAKILEINDITPIGDCIGGGVMIYSASRGCIVKDYKFGDIFDPVLTVYSKQEIVLNKGDAVPEIDAVAFDGWTEITPTYVWDEGAITDGKMNAGIWICTITATDANGNYATATVRVTVKDELKFTVTFDGKDEAEYAYGAKIEKPADPTKASTEKYQYTFDGWYNGETKWDFENDIITADVELTAKFIQSDVYYKVSVTMDGETQVIYVTYGAQVDLSAFDKEGFTKVVKQNGEEITSLIVTADVAVEISYTAKDSGEKDNGKKKGCGSSIVGGSAVVTMLGVGLALGKRRKSNEEEV